CRGTRTADPAVTAAAGRPRDRVMPDERSDLMVLTVQALTRVRAIAQELEAGGRARDDVDREIRESMADVVRFPPATLYRRCPCGGSGPPSVSRPTPPSRRLPRRPRPPPTLPR